MPDSRAATELAVRLLDPLTAIIARAAAAIGQFSPASVETRTKADRSSVTAADLASEAVILAGLAEAAPDTAVVSEERCAQDGPPALGDVFFLVDPLDGTREYLAGRDEYAINLALIAHGQPVLGIIAVPARQLLWRGIAGQGAQRLTLGKGSAAKASSIRTRAVPPSGAVATVSRSHLDPATEALLSRIPVSERHAAGSALKFCLIAEGTADIYPRLSQTSEWDLAAGHALVCAAGGAVTTPEGGPMSYGKVKGQFLVPGFIACGDPAWAKSHLQKR